MSALAQEMVAALPLSPGIACVYKQERQWLYRIPYLRGHRAIVESDGKRSELGRGAIRLIGRAIIAADPTDQFHDAETVARVPAASAFTQANAR